MFPKHFLLSLTFARN